MPPPYRLLIIDDDEEILGTLSDFFKKKNYDVTSAANGLDGLQIIEKETDGFDAIITDIVMPNISGVGVISIVKKKFPAICIVAITGWGEHPEALAIKAQADRVLRKPFELAEFEKIITDLIAEKHAGNDEAS
jgi:DNA-binding response OmpR family regulator